MPRLDLDGGVIVHQVPTPSLGDHSYVVVIGDAAAVIDPQRDIERVVALLGSAEPAAVVETHVHNDYVSGGSHLASDYGCRYVLPAGSGVELAHDPVGDGGTISIVDGWRLRAIHTPGHTPHHTSYALTSDAGEVVVFTGGSMLVGAVGRTDLVDPALTETLTRDQYRSVRLLAESIGEPVTVAPTHGAGSFCVSGPTRNSVSTIGRERVDNPAVTAVDEDSFVADQMASFGLFPAYYAHMAPLNTSGYARLPDPPPEIGPAALEAFDGAVYDIRSARDFAAGHVPGSLNIPYAPSAAAYTGWVGTWNVPAVIVAPSRRRAVTMWSDMARIGYDAVEGIVPDALVAWAASGRPMAVSRVATFADMAATGPATVVDVRDPAEADTVIPEAKRIHVSALDPESFAGEEVWLHCATGYRSAMAASILEAAGVSAVAVIDDFDAYDGPRSRP